MISRLDFCSIFRSKTRRDFIGIARIYRWNSCFNLAANKNRIWMKQSCLWKINSLILLDQVKFDRKITAQDHSTFSVAFAVKSKLNDGISYSLSALHDSDKYALDICMQLKRADCMLHSFCYIYLARCPNIQFPHTPRSPQWGHCTSDDI